MKMVKAKTCTGSEIYINLDRIDYVNPHDNIVYFMDRYITLNEESMKKVVGLIEIYRGERG